MFIIDFILHVDQHLAEFVANYGLWIYGILFLIVFVETGLVVMPFLPGDSLLFAAGALAAISEVRTVDFRVFFLLFARLILCCLIIQLYNIKNTLKSVCVTFSSMS